MSCVIRKKNCQILLHRCVNMECVISIILNGNWSKPETFLKGLFSKNISSIVAAAKGWLDSVLKRYTSAQNADDLMFVKNGQTQPIMVFVSAVDVKSMTIDIQAMFFVVLLLLLLWRKKTRRQLVRNKLIQHYPRRSLWTAVFSLVSFSLQKTGNGVYCAYYEKGHSPEV